MRYVYVYIYMYIYIYTTIASLYVDWLFDGEMSSIYRILFDYAMGIQLTSDGWMIGWGLCYPWYALRTREPGIRDWVRPFAAWYQVAVDFKHIILWIQTTHLGYIWVCSKAGSTIGERGRWWWLRVIQWNCGAVFSMNCTRVMWPLWPRQEYRIQMAQGLGCTLAPPSTSPFSRAWLGGIRVKFFVVRVADEIHVHRGWEIVNWNLW